MAATMLSRVFLDPLRGITPLWKVWWIYGTAFAIVYNALLLTVPRDSVAVRIYLLACLAVASYWAVAIWRCAFNCRSRTLGYFLRATVAASIPAMLVGAYIIVTGDISDRHLTMRWSGP